MCDVPNYFQILGGTLTRNYAYLTSTVLKIAGPPQLNNR